MTRDDFDDWKELTGITRNQAERVIEKPDRSEIFEYGGSFIQLFTKRFMESRPPMLVLVAATQRPDHPPHLSSALKIYYSFLPDGPEPEPSDLFRMVCERFGCGIEIGTANKRFYLCESIPTVPNEPQLRGQPPVINRQGKLGFSAEGLMRLDQASAQWKCALCFAIDHEVYEAYLRSRGR